MFVSHSILVWIFFLFCEVREAWSHGRLMDPPARNAMWRFGYSNPVNYDDNQNWCGGAAVMINQNHGKCGICGDDYADPKPRAHEAGGIYGNGLVVKRYSPGQIVNFEIELTANHQGTFEFKLCPSSNPKEEVTQECLDGHVLEILNVKGEISKQYSIISQEKSKTFYLTARIPDDISCSHCVLQWTYVAANTWGTCKNGTEAVGCGPQETFINCADVAIISNTGARPPGSLTSRIKISEPTALYYSKNAATGEVQPLILRSQVCQAYGSSNSTPGMNDWCQRNCLSYPPNCPEDICTCLSGCEAIGSFKNEKGADSYCQMKCLVYSNKDCPADRCSCH